ncbi:MAG TPA: PaaI family thioesterase [Thermoleophilaceae bacterium]|nr:PaaI family thioesterase [Thermoleophilaceae bacterium]
MGVPPPRRHPALRPARAIEERLTHHDLCFGCGQANVFGLQLEVARRAEGGVAGRFFVKQDHQGPPGYAHGGVVATALDEAMALLLHGQGTYALTGRLEVELKAPAAVGSFIDVEADVVEVEGRRLTLEASASGDDGTVALARGTFVELEAGEGSPGVDRG